MNLAVLILAALSIVSAVFAFSFFVNIRTFGKNAKTTVGTVVGMSGKRALVHFKCEKRVLTAPAAGFDGAAVFAGQRVTIKYLQNERRPDKWDIRIIGKAGYGQKRVRRMAIGCGCCSVVCFFLTIVTAIYVTGL